MDHVHWKHTCQHVYVYRHSCFWPSNAWDSWAVASDNDSTTGALEAAKLSSHGSSVLPQPQKISHPVRMSTSNAGSPEQLDGLVMRDARIHAQTQAFEHGKRSRVPRIIVCEGNQTNDRQKKVKSLGAPMTKSLGCLDGWVFPQLSQIASHL